MTYITKTLILTLALLSTGCIGNDEKESVATGGMQCGAGKCGVSMMDGSTILVEKKMEILSQLREKDSRRECVLNAKTTKDLLNCVRDKTTNRISTKCDSSNTVVPPSEVPIMKCAPGKCGANM